MIRNLYTIECNCSVVVVNQPTVVDSVSGSGYCGSGAVVSAGGVTTTGATVVLVVVVVVLVVVVVVVVTGVIMFTDSTYPEPEKLFVFCAVLPNGFR